MSEAEAKWTEDRVVRLRTLHRAGLSHTEISAELGGISRSGVGAKLRRIGFKDNHKPRSRPKTQTFINAVSVNHNIERRKLDRPPAEALVIGAPLLIPLLDLKRHHCRWPIGTPGQADFGFCGHQRQAERPYCEAHVKVAYVRTPRQKAA